MIPSVSWMVHADWLILFFLSEHRWRFVATPAVIAENVDISNSHASRRLKRLLGAGLVEQHSRGHYRITDRGVRYVMGELGEDRLEELDPEIDG